MKIDNIPDYIDPSLNLEQIRDECHDLIQKRAYVSAGAAIVPIPFFDVVVDLGILTQLIPDINARFGLAPEHVSVYDPKQKLFIGMNCVNVAFNFQVLWSRVQPLKNL